VELGDEAKESGTCNITSLAALPLDGIEAVSIGTEIGDDL